ncbi:MAG TPA: tetratricopeptide repeat protein [Candidatus Sulfotelmatobacter sp.]|nr:tetratricopeptide repeat protein [Candidatus Sulfotelmatobacter sp.]
MEDRTRNILIGLIVLFLVMGVGSAIILPSLNREVDPGVAEHARGRRLMGEGKFGEAQGIFLEVLKKYPGTASAAQAQADKDYGIPYHQALRSAQAGQTAEAVTTLNRVAREGAKTEWGGKAIEELARLGQPAPAAAGDEAAARREQARQARLAQANALVEQGNAEEARRMFQGLVQEGAGDAVEAAARLALTTLQATDDAVRSNPEVARARVALHRARASLLAYRGANGRFPPTLQDRGLEQFGFSYPDLLNDVRRVESYQPEGAGRFEITAVARDARGTRVRATEGAVEDLP